MQDMNGANITRKLDNTIQNFDRERRDGSRQEAAMYPTFRTLNCHTPMKHSYLVHKNY